MNTRRLRGVRDALVRSEAKVAELTETAGAAEKKFAEATAKSAAKYSTKQK
jgi:hypothetical protein